jgi:carbon monoxide dehydrogenase subunit G
MAEVSTSAVLAAPAEAVWRLLEDFGDIQRWWPTDGLVRIEQVATEGQGVGMIRHIKNEGARHPVSERLDFLDAASRTIVLSIIGARPPGITAYVAEGHVVAVDPSHCRIDYRALIATAPGREQQVRDAVLKTWALMFKGLELAATRTV